ncbi:MAG: hypothetical protein CO103_07570 [Chloroflexi bacterium CG_4_9_14_3_um_filter_45_9]|nr:MAG: hypothetical protein COZ67_03070 [Chloroflexi bacterium CG_4_8_14_3_um_filter_45_15]PJB48250.1 MAG: hypothetical protein CO103_07570 [Chloroflexi bacterium CG_4_9_14_3_um_filter_45_9]
MDKLLIRFTKSRPRHTDDNGLVETKNGSVVRKNLGYAYIPQAYAELLNEYHKGFLNPYINFHRPCFFPVSVIDHRGKIKKTYPEFKNVVAQFIGQLCLMNQATTKIWG